MLVVAVARLVSRLVSWLTDRWARPAEEAWPPELLDVDRRASVAMAMCTCGHMWDRHERPHVRTSCRACGCQRFRPGQRPDAGTARYL